MGQAPRGDAYNNDGEGWPLIAGAGDFDNSGLNPKKFTTIATRISRPGDIILSIRASIGDRVLSAGEYCLGRGVAALRPSNKLDQRYLWHWLDHSAELLASKGRGATFKQVNRRDISELPLTLPPMAYQRKAGSILDAVDAIQIRRIRAVSLLDELAQSTFIKMFGSDQGTDRTSLGEHLSFVTSGGRGWAKYYSDSGSSRFIRSLDVRMNEIEDQNAVYVSAPDNAEARRTRTQEGDVLLTITGSLIGRVAPVPAALSGSYVSQHVAILRAKGSLRHRFLSFYLSLPSGGQRQIQKMQYGQTKPGLNFNQIRSLEIPIPQVRRQDEFLQRLKLIEQLRNKQVDQLARLRMLRLSLQHSAFGGDLKNQHVA